MHRLIFKKYFKLFFLAIVLFFSICLLNKTFVKISNVSILDSSEKSESASIPFFANSPKPNEEYIFTGKIYYNSFSQKIVKIIPDDCLESLSINGKIVDLSRFEDQRCDWGNGFSLRIGDYLNEGENNFEIKIKDFGGKFGLNIESDARDFNYLLLSLAILIAVSALISSILISALKIRKRSGIFIVALSVFFALSARFYLLDFHSLDYSSFLGPWQDFIKEHGGFSALKYNFSDYNVPYLYFLAIFNYLPISGLYAVKFISIFFDFLSASFAFMLAKEKSKTETLPILIFASVLFAPTVIFNGAYWGQCDSIYSAFLIMFIYFLTRGRSLLSSLFFGIAFSFKLHSVFLSPIFIIMFLRRKIPFHHLLMIPASYFALLIPSFIFGRSMKDLLLIYWRQTQTYTSLTLNAPSVYQWLPQEGEKAKIFGTAGLIFASVIIAIFVYLFSRRGWMIKKEQIIKISFACLIMIPFLLPRMHERYFFPADIFSIIYAYYFPRYFFIPIGMQIISFLSYGPFLFGYSPDFKALSIGIFTLILIVLIDLIFDACCFARDDIGENLNPKMAKNEN